MSMTIEEIVKLFEFIEKLEPTGPRIPAILAFIAACPSMQLEFIAADLKVTKNYICMLIKGKRDNSPSWRFRIRFDRYLDTLATRLNRSRGLI